MAVLVSVIYDMLATFKLNSFRERPAALHPIRNAQHWHVKYFAPLRQAASLAFVFDAAVASRVSSLLSRCCPTTISRRVVLIVVDSVESVLARWRFSHVTQELTEVAPSAAYLNALAEIEVRPSPSFGFATAVHGSPASVGIALLCYVVVATRMAVNRHGLPVQAATTFVMPRAEVASECYGRSSAVALAKPTHLNQCVRGSLQNNKSSESTAC